LDGDESRKFSILEQIANAFTGWRAATPLAPLCCTRICDSSYKESEGGGSLELRRQYSQLLKRIIHDE